MKKKQWKALAREHEQMSDDLLAEIDAMRKTLDAVWRALDGPVMQIESVRVNVPGWGPSAHDGVFVVESNAEALKSRQADLIVLARKRMARVRKLERLLEP